MMMLWRNANDDDHANHENANHGPVHKTTKRHHHQQEEEEEEQQKRRNKQNSFRHCCYYVLLLVLVLFVCNDTKKDHWFVVVDGFQYHLTRHVNNNYNKNPTIVTRTSSSRRTARFAFSNDPQQDNEQRQSFKHQPMPINQNKDATTNRRNVICKSLLMVVGSATMTPSGNANAFDESSATAVTSPPVLASLTGDVKQLFNEGRAKEMQGNVAAAQRIYTKVTKISPQFIYGWSNLGNTQVVMGSLEDAEQSYTKSIDLCQQQLKEMGDQITFGIKRCDDLYILLLNRGTVRLNNHQAKEALGDLQMADRLRGKPDAVILQNLARAYELNSMYGQADRDYTTAISMTSNEVAPFWLRSALVKYQLGERLGALDLVRRVEVRFPEAPEVRAAVAVLLWSKGDTETARKKFLEIPNVARLKFSSMDYLQNTISWPPSMIATLQEITKAVGDT